MSRPFFFAHWPGSPAREASFLGRKNILGKPHEAVPLNHAKIMLNLSLCR
jgi:hypothetical protein